MVLQCTWPQQELFFTGEECIRLFNGVSPGRALP